jgi:hypothetical protein
MVIGPFSFRDFPTWLQDVLIIAGILILLAAVVGFVRKTWPALKAFVETVISLQNLPAFMETTTKTLAAQDARQRDVATGLIAQNVQIAEIHHEIRLNTGTSVKDTVIRLETSIGGVSDRQVKVLAAQTRIEKGVAGLYERTAALERTQPTRPKPIRRPKGT